MAGIKYFLIITKLHNLSHKIHMFIQLMTADVITAKYIGKCV